MSRSRDQDAVDALIAQITADDAPSTNGNGNHAPSIPADASDEQVIEKARSEKNGKFDRLWNGDMSEYGNNPSRADEGFVWKLYPYTQDEQQIRRIHAMSALHRQKSASRHEYLRYSLENARKGVTWFYEWPGTNGNKSSSSSSSPLSNSDDDDAVTLPKAVPFCEMGEPKEHRDLLEGLVPEGYPTVFYGDGGSAKSMLALSLGVAVAGDADKWLGRAVSTAPVLYADFELDANEQNRRVRRITSGAGLEQVPQELYYLSVLGHNPTTAFAAAYEECQERGVKLLILDSFGPALAGDSEAAKDIIAFFGRVMEPFRALGVAVVVVDHQARQQAGERYQGKSAFGSVYKTNLSRSVVQIEATTRGSDYLDLRLRHKKHNFGPTAAPFGAQVTFGERVTITVQDLDDADLAEEGTLNSEDRVLLALQNGPAFPDELVERTGLQRGNVSNCITKLKKTDKIETTGERQGRAEQVQIASSSSQPYRDDDDDDDDGGDVQALFADPPGWLRKQIGLALKDPDRHTRPLRHAVAAHLGRNDADIADEFKRELSKWSL